MGREKVGPRPNARLARCRSSATRGSNRPQAAHQGAIDWRCDQLCNRMRAKGCYTEEQIRESAKAFRKRKVDHSPFATFRRRIASLRPCSYVSQPRQLLDRLTQRREFGVCVNGGSAPRSHLPASALRAIPAATPARSMIRLNAMPAPDLPAMERLRESWATCHRWRASRKTLLQSSSEISKRSPIGQRVKL